MLPNLRTILIVACASHLLAPMAEAQTPIRAAASALIINIDFNGQGVGDAPLGTYSGPGAVGAGTVFNGLAADSTAGDVNLNFGRNDLLDDSGSPTRIWFHLGGPYEGMGVGGEANGSHPLNDDYVFNNMGGNSSPNGTGFTIGGLAGFAPPNVYLFIEAGAAGTTVGGKSGVGPLTLNGIPNVYLYEDVPVSSPFPGEYVVSGTFSAGAPGVLNGLTFDSTPEPTSAAIVSIGGLGLLLRRRREAV